MGTTVKPEDCEFTKVADYTVAKVGKAGIRFRVGTYDGKTFYVDNSKSVTTYTNTPFGPVETK